MRRGQYIFLTGWMAATVTLLSVLLQAPQTRSQPNPDPRPTPLMLAPMSLALDIGAIQAPQVTPSIDLSPAIGQARGRLAGSIDSARRYASLERGSASLTRASQLLRQHPSEALELVARVLEVPQTEDLTNRAWWIRGEAERSLGHYDEALDAWSQVGSTPVDDYLELRRIQALLAVGEPDEAARRARELIEALEGGTAVTIHTARELRLRALHEARRWDDLVAEAPAFLDRYEEYPRTDELLLWIGQAHIARDDGESAAFALDRVVWEFPYRPLAQPAWVLLQTLRTAGVEVPSHSFAARFERAHRLRINKHWDLVDTTLAQLLDDVLDRYGEVSLTNEIRLERARNAYGADDYASALAHLMEIVEHHEEGISSYELWSLISETHARLGDFEAGADALRHRDRGRSRVSRHQALADFYFDNGFFDRALEHRNEVLSERRRRGWDYSLLLFAAGEYDDAAERFEELADHAGGVRRARYRYFEARSLQETGHLEQARALFDEIRTDRGRGYYGLQAYNRLVELDRYEPPTLYVDLEAAPRDVLPAETARSEAERPRTLEVLAEDLLREAHLELSQLVRASVDDTAPPSPDPTTGRFARPARLHWDGPDGVADTRLALLASPHEIEGAYTEPVDEGALAGLADEYGDLFPQVVRSEFLYTVGQTREARVEGRDASIEFRALDRSFRHRRPRLDRPIELRNRLNAHFIDNRSRETGFWGVRLGAYRYPVPDDRSGRRQEAERQIAIYDARLDLRTDFHQGLMTLGDYHLVRRFARETGEWRSNEPDGEGAEIWSEVYPRAYPELVTEYADRWDVNPYIIWALMHVESSFNPDSISRANARGLLQVIPKTGELISQRLGYYDFGPHNLMDPELSIEFGCYYFSELMTKFHGQELLAFAGYNGGPHNVARWLEGRGDLPLDAFIETIPFEQAREYSKKVYRYLVLFRMIYLGEDTLYVGQVIDPDYEDNIHF